MSFTSNLLQSLLNLVLCDLLGHASYKSLEGVFAMDWSTEGQNLIDGDNRYFLTPSFRNFHEEWSKFILSWKCSLLQAYHVLLHFPLLNFLQIKGKILHQQKKKVTTLLIAILALLQWSETEPEYLQGLYTVVHLSTYLLPTY